MITSIYHVIFTIGPMFIMIKPIRSLVNTLKYEPTSKGLTGGGYRSGGKGEEPSWKSGGVTPKTTIEIFQRWRLKTTNVISVSNIYEIRRLWQKNDNRSLPDFIS